MAFIMGLVVLFLFHTKIRADLLHIQDKKNKIAIQRVQLIAKEITDTASVQIVSLILMEMKSHLITNHGK